MVEKQIEPVGLGASTQCACEIAAGVRDGGGSREEPSTKGVGIGRKCAVLSCF